MRVSGERMDLGILLRWEVLLETEVGWWGGVGVLVTSGVGAAVEKFYDPNAEMDAWQNFPEDMTKAKKLIRIHITSDTVCPRCFIGKKYLEKATVQVKDEYGFEVKCHPFFLNPNGPKEGVSKLEFFKKKFGDAQIAPILDRINKVFTDLGLTFSPSGKIGNMLDNNRLIELAGHQGLETQNKLVEELFINYFSEKKYIGDKKFLVAATEKVGLKGAKEFLDDPNAGLKEV